ncbi:hypothetical protein MalM25_37420 [Planctomycetes bacterium MalM25]|nr:hypothetical protein MalM25_37420 [Planctomycetes bacterium MalM25]
MFRALLLAAALLASSTLAHARNPNYYGTPRGVSARTYSGIYQAQRPNIVPTFSLPTYGAGYRTYYRGGYAPYGYYPIYRQPIVVYQPAVVYGF